MKFYIKDLSGDIYDAIGQSRYPARLVSLDAVLWKVRRTKVISRTLENVSFDALVKASRGIR